MNVVPMEPVARKPPPRAKKPPAPAAARAEKRAMAKASGKEIQAQMWSAGALGSIAAVITGLSLSHLANGITVVSGTGGWQSWAMAVGIDASQASTLPFQIAGAVFGIAVPAAIYVLMRQAAAHYLDAHKRS
jgi:hypothetical protein